MNEIESIKDTIFKIGLEQNREAWAESGIQFGYPICCIQSFCSQLPSERTPNQNVIANVGHGFIPCPDHAYLINTGKIRIEQLVIGRNPQFKPFPNE